VPCKRTLRRLTPAGCKERVFDAWDFYRFCDRENAHAFAAETPLPGAYPVYDKTHVIFISHRVRGPERLSVQFHEPGHHRLNYPGAQFFIDLSSDVAPTIINTTCVERLNCVLPEMWD